MDVEGIEYDMIDRILEDSRAKDLIDEVSRKPIISFFLFKI